VGKSSLVARQELAELRAFGNQVPLEDKREKVQEWDLRLCKNSEIIGFVDSSLDKIIPCSLQARLEWN